MCPYCDARFRKPAYDGAEIASEPVVRAISDGPPASTSPGGRPALLSLIIAAIALAAEIVLLIMAVRTPQVSSVLTVSACGTTLLAVYAIHAARQAERRSENTRDKRELTMARYGLILGMATIACVVSSFITWSIDQVINRL